MHRVAVALILLLVAAGCGTAPAPATTPEPFTVPTAESATTTSVVLSPEEQELFGPRVQLPGGLLLKEFGRVAQYGGLNDADPREGWGIRVVLDDVQVDPTTCDEYVSEPERGHRLVLSVRVETSANYQVGIDDGPYYYRWTVTGPDGITEASSSVGAQCNSAEELPFDLRPSAQYRGQVVLDTRYASGQLVLDNAYVWNFPAEAS